MRLAGDCAVCGWAAADWEPADAIRLLGHAGRLLADVLAGQPDPTRSAAARAQLSALPQDPSGLSAPSLVSATHTLTHALAAAGRLRWDGAARQHGRVAAVHTGSGGVPKLPVAHAAVGRRGLTGDRQASRAHHGSPYQAVCLWSTQVLDRLAAEGHPIGPGRAGENLTLAGLDWPRLRPGMRLSVGTALLEITGYATPCRANGRWFADGDFWRMAHEREPGVSRLYARVLGEGTVAVGQAVVVEPAGVPAAASGRMGS